MSLAAGTRLGAYEIISALGAGGMGEVYRAHDTNLKRAVAIKVLPQSVATDAERLARFQREAEVLASLNHPNIAGIYGLERSDGTTALVMELVEGPTLADRIARGRLPVDEALPVAKQIAEALEAAHEQGIIHRDLKPANIKVRPDGTVKVLDFGLAKVLEPPHLAMDGAQSPTITSPAMMTSVGVLLGTAAYMSPEQAKGREADRRSDIWAFGTVLYEMLSGKRAFIGDDVSDTLTAVLRDDPDWSALPANAPARIRQAMRVCLQRDPKQRAQAIGDVRLALEGAFETTVPQATASVAAPLWRRFGALTAGALVVASITGAMVWVATRPVPPRVSRLHFTPSGTAALTINNAERDLAITPDGSRVVYVGNRGSQLFVRALAALEPVAVFTGAPRGPFVSPDGQWIGFVDGVGVLKKVAMTGGPAITLATVEGGPSRGATWSSDGTIVFATAGTGLQSVPAAGGPTAVVTRLDSAQGEAGHQWPEWLPGGRAVLFTITARTGGLDAARVAVLDLQTGERTILVRGGSDAHYVSSGHLLYTAAGTLRAVPFDLARLEARGTPVSVLSNVLMTPFGAVDAVVAGDGTLAYISGGSVTGVAAPRTLVWVDRQGRETLIPTPPRPYMFPRVSPDGTRIAVHAADQEFDLWVWDLARGTLTRLTSEPGQDTYPVWTPDGQRILFASNRDTALFMNLYLQVADGSGSATRLTESPNGQIPSATTADGTRLVFHELTPTRQRDLMLLTLTPTPRVEPLLETRFDESNGIVSPDGHWLAYQSNSSGQFEIYVRPFPNVGAGQSQVSNAGGVQPVWGRSGRELFYKTPNGALMAVPIDPRGATWGAGAATKVVEGHYFTGAGNQTRQYDVSPDAQRFLMIKEGSGSDQTAATTSLIVVQHWFEELNQLAPTR
jgi:eukaryotic-like serine/threonine-protein kinase